jgi:two-component system CitB family sensor kinase
MVMDPDSELPELAPNGEEVVITILGNLIENAYESLAAAGTPKGCIIVSLRVMEGALELRVRDNGSGFPAELRDRIFEKGFSTKSPHKNMGMGLYLVRSVVEQYRGACEVALDEGVTFLVTLPLSALQKGDMVHGPDTGDDRRG